MKKHRILSLLLTAVMLIPANMTAFAYDKTSKELIGTITDVRVEPGRYNINMMDGSYKEAIPEGRYNVYVTVEFDGKAGDSGYYTAANKFLGVGSWVTVVTKYSECGAMVTSISLAQ